MTATILFDDILAAMPKDERAAVDARASEMLADIDGLAEPQRPTDVHPAVAGGRGAG
jgi:hypothetical protein